MAPGVSGDFCTGINADTGAAIAEPKYAAYTPIPDAATAGCDVAASCANARQYRSKDTPSSSQCWPSPYVINYNGVVDSYKCPAVATTVGGAVSSEHCCELCWYVLVSPAHLHPGPCFCAFSPTLFPVTLLHFSKTKVDSLNGAKRFHFIHAFPGIFSPRCVLSGREPRARPVRAVLGPSVTMGTALPVEGAAGHPTPGNTKTKTPN